ncbi:hypothetical protein KUTeg_022396, partial [Tegillarca granosa]
MIVFMMLSPEKEEYLHSIWTDPKHPGSFSGPDKLKPKLFRTDKGREFDNKLVLEFLKQNNVHIIFKQNETKSNFAERAIQNIKNRMYRMFTQRQSYEYIKQLPHIINSINNTPSRPLKDMRPSDVNKNNEDEVRLNAYLITSYNLIVHLPRQLSFSGNWTVSLLEFTYLGAKPAEPELYVYCNLCDNTIVGEREVPLLRRIYVANSINHIFEYPYEAPLKTVAFQDIQIYINDSKQELASFLSGEVTVTTMSGKTTLTYEILKNSNGMFEITPTKIIIAYGEWQPLFDKMEENVPNIIFHQGLPSRDDIDQWSTNSEHTVLVIDDLIAQVTKSEDTAYLMSRAIRTHLPFLTVLYKAHTKQRRALLRSLSDEQF